MSAYISNDGRIFARQTMVTGRGSATRDSDPDSKDERSSTEFSGQSLVAMFGAKENAWRTVISFLGNYETCTAEVTRAKPDGSPMNVSVSGITGKLVEVKSVKINIRSCLIVQGNVFGEEKIKGAPAPVSAPRSNVLTWANGLHEHRRHEGGLPTTVSELHANRLLARIAGTKVRLRETVSRSTGLAFRAPAIRQHHRVAS